MRRSRTLCLGPFSSARAFCFGAEFLDVVQNSLEEVVLLALVLGDLSPGRAEGSEDIVRPFGNADLVLGGKISERVGLELCLFAKCLIKDRVADVLDHGALFGA